MRRNRTAALGLVLILLLAAAAAWYYRARQDTTTADWKASTQNGVTFRYPDKLSTTYITAMDWPPQLQLIDGPFECTEAGSETARAGRIERRMVDDRTYCRTTVTEGAAGSIYTQYAYAGPMGNKVVILSFSVRAVQCSNYGELQESQCEAEREAFDMDGVMDRIFRTLE